MAVDRFNAQTGGISGVKVEVAPSGGDVPALTADRAVLGVVGPPDGGSALRAGPMLDAAQLGFVSPSATAAKVTDSGWHVAHRLLARDDLTGPVAAEFAFGPPIEARSVSIVGGGDVDSTGLGDEFQKRAAALGIKVERTSLAGIADASDEIARIAAAKPAAVFFPDGGGHCDLLAAIHRQTPAARLLVTAGCASAAPAGTYVFDGRLDRGSSPEELAWAKEYQSRFGAAPGPFAADAYDASNIVLQAIQRAAAAKGNLDLKPAGVAREISRTTGFKGLGGPVSFDARGDLASGTVAIGQTGPGAVTLLKVVKSP